MRVFAMMLSLPFLFYQFAFCQKPAAPKTQAQTNQGSASSASSAKQEPKSKHKEATSEAFLCPVPEAKKACDSYQELKRANDRTFIDIFSPTKIVFVCFRPNVDEFIIAYYKPPQWGSQQHFDKQRKKMMINEDASEPGIASTVTFKNGIQDGTVIPSALFRGIWKYHGSLGLRFNGQDFNDKYEDAISQPLLTIDDWQLAINDYKYQNASNKTVHYNLTIQKSTGRFTENFKQEDEKFPFIDQAGRCLVIGK
jgi:hypothetical protein